MTAEKGPERLRMVLREAAYIARVQFPGDFEAQLRYIAGLLTDIADTERRP